MGLVDEAFESLFFGSGSWLGLLLFLSIIIALLLKWKYTGALLLPITIFLGIEYMNKASETNNLAWHCIIMFLSSVFILMYLVNQLKRR